MIAPLLTRLREEQQVHLRGGIYHFTQVQFCYNSNRIEGSCLTEEQTRWIFETNTLNLENGGTVNVDDIIETVNHFSCFEYMLAHADAALSQRMIRDFHRILKNNTSDAKKEWFMVGEYKARPNMVGNTETTPPAQVAGAMEELLTEYNKKKTRTFEDLVAWHYHFEKIHPFQDGNGRVGRLILFKECLKQGIMPFIIDEAHKLFYYRGLQEFERTPGYLLDTCRSAQDTYAERVTYFDIR